MPEGLTPEKVIALGKKIRKALVATLAPEERLAGLAPEDRVAGLAPKDRLAGLTPKDVPELLEQIDVFLHQQGKK